MGSAARRARLLPLLALLLGLSGCTSYGAAAFLSTPSGAEVVDMRDDSLLGTTPFRYLWDDRDGREERLITVRVYKPGYVPRVTALRVVARHGSPEEAYRNALGVEVALEEER